MYFINTISKTPMSAEAVCYAEPDWAINLETASDDSLAAKGYARLVIEPRPDGNWDEIVTLDEPSESDDGWVRSWTVSRNSEAAAVLTHAKSDAIIAVDEAFDAWAATYITLSPAVSDVYDRNQSDAKAYQDDGSVGVWLQVVMDSHDLSADAATALILGQAQVLEVLGPLAEGVRQRAKVRVKAATTPLGCQAIIAGLSWPHWDSDNNTVIWPDGEPLE